MDFTAHNGIGSDATQTFTLTVNQPASFTSTNNTAFTVGTAGSFIVAASGFPAPTLTEIGSDTLPSGVTFTPATGMLAGTPAAGTGGTYTLHFTAHNGIGSDASQTFTLTVNQPAAFTSTTNTTFLVGSAGSVTVAATGFPVPTLSENASDTLPSGVAFTPATGVLAGTPAAGSGGTYTLHFTADNGIDSDATQTFTLTVNQPAAFTSADNTAFTVGIAGSFIVAISGFPDPVLSGSDSDPLPSGVTFTPSTGVLAETPAAGTVGTYILHFTARNGVGADATQTVTLTVNQSAAFTSTNNTAFTVGNAGSFTVAASGASAPILSESNADTLPSGVTFTAATGILAGAPAAESGGTYTLHFTAHNGVGIDAIQTFTLTVNQPAAFTSANNTAFTSGTAGSFTIAASGFPAPTLSESNTDTLPSGVTFTAATGILAGTPTAGTGGTYTLHFTADNGIGSDATQTFTLTVGQPAAFTSANNTAFAVGSADSFTVAASGFPAPTLSESGTDTLPSGVTFSPTTGILAGTPAVGSAGSYTLHFTAHNGIGADATQTFTLTVVQTPLSITTTTLPSYVTQGQPYNATIATTGGVAPLAFSVSAGTLPAGLNLALSTGVISGTPAAYGTSTFTVQAQGASGAPATQAYTVVIVPPEFVYNQTTDTLVITLIPSLPSFQFSQATTASGTTTVYTFTLSGSSAPTVSEPFPSSMLTTSPASGGASVSVIGQGLAGTAILITKDTYVDQNGNTQETPARISLGSLTDDGAGTISKFVGNDLNNPEYTFLSLENFPLSYAYAGRNDGTIQLYGTENTGKVGFVTAGYYSYIASAVTGVYAHFGEGTPEVVGTSAGNPDDFAYHYTSSSPSTVSTITSVYTVNGITSSSMQGSQTNPEDGGAIDTFDNVALGFVLNTAVAYTGNSIALINDSPMSDTYVGKATDPLGLASIGGIAGFSYMFVGAYPNFNEFDVAYGFGTYYASSTMGGHDIDYPGAAGQQRLQRRLDPVFQLAPPASRRACPGGVDARAPKRPAARLLRSSRAASLSPAKAISPFPYPRSSSALSAFSAVRHPSCCAIRRCADR